MRMINSSPALNPQSDYKPKNCSLDMISVPLPNYLPQLDERIKVQGFHAVLLEQHRKTKATMRAVSKLLGVHEVTYQLYLTGKNRPDFKMLKKLSQVYGTDLFQIAFDGNYAFVVKKKVVNLPRELTIDLAYYVGYLQGDGYISRYDRHIGFCDEYKAQMEKIDGLTRKIFNIQGVLKSQMTVLSKKPCYKLTVNSMAVNSFLSEVFGINKGVKKDLKVPRILFENEELLRNYVSGLYDADGTLPKNPAKAKQLFLDITMKDKQFIEEIQCILGSFGITSLKLYERRTHSFVGNPDSPSWEIQIRRKKEIQHFLERIGFKHPDKSRRAIEVMAMLV